MRTGPAEKKVSATGLEWQIAACKTARKTAPTAPEVAMAAVRSPNRHRKTPSPWRRTLQIRDVSPRSMPFRIPSTARVAGG